MGYFNSRGLRGSALEELINFTNSHYHDKGLALIQKIPTPITPIEVDNQSRHITLAYFDKKSTVDYIGAVQGVPVCFDAKESAVDTFSLQNVHDHQMEFMRDFEKQGGVAFILIFFSHRDLFYYMSCRELSVFYDRAKAGGRKSIRFEELRERFFLKNANNGMVPYLELLKKDLEELDEGKTE